jgi:hypothetical protein
LRFARDEVGAHREVGAREIECVFVFHYRTRKLTAGKMSVNERPARGFELIRGL